MHVRVLEARHQHPSAQIHDLGARPDEVADVIVADRDDPAAADRHGGGARAHGVRREDRPSGEDEIGVGHGMTPESGR